jgi:hypothetical protein
VQRAPEPRFGIGQLPGRASMALPARSHRKAIGYADGSALTVPLPMTDGFSLGVSAGVINE